MSRPVTLNITGRQSGKWQISPFTYEANAGLQRLSDGSFVRYEVPLYFVEVQGGRSFKAVRFGLVNRREPIPPATRHCDAGLTKARTVQAEWVAGYSPHSFRLPGRAGAWRVFRHFLIHQGSTGSTIGGSLGCIEIVGNGEWDQFLALLENLAGAPCPMIGRTHSLTVRVEEAPYANAILVSP